MNMKNKEGKMLYLTLMLLIGISTAIGSAIAILVIGLLFFGTLFS